MYHPPLHLFCGGNAAGEDHMSYLSMGNVEHHSWLYWVHAFVVWGVVLIVQASIYRAQERFLPKRFQWLRDMPEPRCTTLLVENIPEELQSDQKLMEEFQLLYPGKIKCAYVVKKSKHLADLVDQRTAAKETLSDAEARWAQDGNAPSKRPLTWWGKEDIIDTSRAEIQRLQKIITEERIKLNEAAATSVGGVYAYSGFVTFKKRSDAELAEAVQYQTDAEKFVLSIPPEPSSIIWADLQVEPHKQQVLEAMGYICIAGLYFTYMPLVIGITNIATAINMGPLQPLWKGMAPTFGLNFMVGWLPTFLLTIFRTFFCLKDDAWAQKQLQSSYFIFQVVFVLLVTSIGSDIIGFTKTALADPFGLIPLFAETMPFATHFYMNYMVLQWVTHMSNFTRQDILQNYIIYSRMYPPEEAAEKAGEEDADFMGLGARTTRQTINLIIGIVFCTLCPPMTFLVFINFFISRVVYGWLIVYSETKKPDLGGVFWVTQMQHLYVGNMIYVLLMAGVLQGRAASGIPASIALSSLGYVIISYRRFNKAFSWEKLPFIELATTKFDDKEQVGAYCQKELIETEDDSAAYAVAGAEPAPSNPAGN